MIWTSKAITESSVPRDAKLTFTSNAGKKTKSI